MEVNVEASSLKFHDALFTKRTREIQGAAQ
jgi:hypothetical protein